MTIYEAVQSCMDDWKSQSEAAKEPGFDAQAAADRALELFEEAMAEWLTHNGFSTDHNEPAD